MVDNYSYHDDKISIVHRYGSTCGARKVTKPLFDLFYNQLIRHRDWVNGTDNRWNLWALASYEKLSEPHTRWPNIVGVTLTYEQNAGESMMSQISIPGRRILHECEGWKVTTDQQQFIVAMHVFVSREE